MRKLRKGGGGRGMPLKIKINIETCISQHVYTERLVLVGDGVRLEVTLELLREEVWFDYMQV